MALFDREKLALASVNLEEAQKVLDEISSHPGFIFNLGHGMIPSAKIECVDALMEVVTGRKTLDNYE